MDPQQQFCLKWNSFSSNLAITFSNLFKSDLLADVTLSCDGAVFRAHKLILAACSKKFADLFENTPTNGQCVIILEATTPDNMAALLEFMYKGEVHVSQEALNSFLKSAESLQVKGLSTETGRLAAQQAQQQHMGGDSSPLDSPTGRRSMRNSLSGSSGVAIGIGGNNNNSGTANSPAISGNNGLSLAGALSGMAAAGGMAAAASVAASGLSALATSAGALDRCGSAGGNIISGSVAGVGPLSAGSGVGSGNGGNGNGGNGVHLGGNNGPISLSGSGAGAAMHLGGGSTGSLKQECDSLMHPSSSSQLGMAYVPPMYHRPMSFNEPLRKRALRSPYAEQELRGSVLRDGSKNSSECPSPINKQPYHRPSSSASSTAPTEADTMHSERASPQSSRYENHSPSTTAGNGNAPSGLDRIVKSERNNGSANEANDDERELMDESTDNGAEDLRVKLENSNYSPPPANSNTSSTTPNALLENLKNADGSLSGNLAASIAPADMLNVWNATKMNNKNSVNTADGKKLKCLYCDRLYGYETNLRAHIRQRHQGIRVPCPFCERTFTRNNTVRRHIAREHKQEIGLAAGATIAPAHVAAAAAAAAAANHSP
ncbi:zinc finger protein chinmo isoform X1 [Drosophila albomicans]|uniref:Zinc finger protein chinmo isoform X1 n=1 Tax=Drosophila albomicans TaxID=7291 RepID=A0A6P8XID0_DROAB|nr:zinc finger protein chinmo isoform X1 [Drosophila albomicans]